MSLSSRVQDCSLVVAVDDVSGATGGSVDNSKRVCGPVCKGVRDTATLPKNFSSIAAVSVGSVEKLHHFDPPLPFRVHWQKQLWPLQRQTSMYLCWPFASVLSLGLLKDVLVCERSHSLTHTHT